MEYILKHDNLEVKFSSLGAEMISVKHNGKERLWQNDNNTWKGHAPVLFPISGKIDVTVDGITYPLKQHGLARINEFNLKEISDNMISFSLSSNNNFKDLFPYEFELVLTYVLENDSIKVEYEVINRDNKTIYFSIGGHTSFSIDETIDNYNLVLNDDKVIDTWMLKDGLYNGINRVTDNGIIDLSSKYLENAETIIMDNIKSRKVSLVHKNGEKVADFEFDNFPHLLLWHPLNSKMICIEPWHNLLDKVHDKTEFKDKYTIIKLEIKEKALFNQKYTYY